MSTDMRFLKDKRQSSTETAAGSVSFWTKTVGAHITEYNSIIKKSSHKGWPTEDDTKYDYNSDLQRGIYDNGIAVRTGLLHRGPFGGWYLCCIDFDKKETFLAWCDKRLQP